MGRLVLPNPKFNFMRPSIGLLKLTVERIAHVVEGARHVINCSWGMGRASSSMCDLAFTYIIRATNLLDRSYFCFVSLQSNIARPATPLTFRS